MKRKAIWGDALIAAPRAARSAARWQTLFAVIAACVVALVSATSLADDDEGEEHERYAPQAAALKAADAAVVAAWKDECGGCHVPFPPRLLPAASWQKIMANPADHYGTDATIDDAALSEKLTKFLMANAGDPVRLKDVKGTAVPLRVTQTRWFLREHDEIRADVWKRASIKGAANCGACHQGAADGNFSERQIRIPKQ